MDWIISDENSIKFFIVLMGECMILDYNQYIKESGEEGIVNFTKVKNTLDNLQIKSGYCPFCKKKIKNQVYYKWNNKIRWCSAVEYEIVRYTVSGDLTKILH